MRKEYDFSKAKRGAVIPQKGKTRISIYIDDEILEEFRSRADAAGRGYQTMMNDALRKHLGRSGRPLDVETLRRILREELKSAG
ncbi:MAG: BrnA antitoxin family protein [Candidatus Atribacteria bacterium]|nr:BrnA antitoxin family protein [Candidatus Atribacteria bacterium]